jgi:hypothetical protein
MQLFTYSLFALYYLQTYHLGSFFKNAHILQQLGVNQDIDMGHDFVILGHFWSKG